MKFAIRSNADHVMKRMSQRVARMEKQGKNSTLEVAKYGAHYAAKIAPKKSGATSRAIGWTKGKSPASATIVYGDGHPDRRGRIQGKYGLTSWMNSGKATTKWKGTPMFIDATNQKVKERFSRKIRHVVNAFVNEK